MKTIAAILAAVKALLHAVGIKSADKPLEAAEGAVTTIEQLIERLSVHSATGADTVFLSLPTVGAVLYAKFLTALREQANSVEGKGILPRVVVLPEGIDIRVVGDAIDAAKAEAAVLTGAHDVFSSIAKLALSAMEGERDMAVRRRLLDIVSATTVLGAPASTGSAT